MIPVGKWVVVMGEDFGKSPICTDAPTIIFIDELDTGCTKRFDSEKSGIHEI